MLVQQWEKNRMLAYFYIPRLSNDIKIAVQKNHLRAQILKIEEKKVQVFTKFSN